MSHQKLELTTAWMLIAMLSLLYWVRHHSECFRREGTACDETQQKSCNLKEGTECGVSLLAWKDTLPTKLLQSLLPCRLQYSQTWSTMSTNVSRWRESNFSLFSMYVLAKFCYQQQIIVLFIIIKLESLPSESCCTRP